MKEYKVSIIVPVYNVENYLDRCMQSLLSQTLKNIEIILVDDGSPDNCPLMCDEYAKKDSRIKVIHKQNEGLGFARNSGLEVAVGEYVAFVDSDDYVDIAMYEILYKKAKEHNSDVVFCGFNKQNKDKSFTKICECETYLEYQGLDVKYLIPDFIASEPYNEHEYKHDMSVWHSIYKNDIIKNNNIRFISERLYASEDVPFQIDFLLCANKVIFIPDFLYFYCYNGNSLTKNVDFEKFNRIKELYYLLLAKSKLYDSEGLRSKRLLIGYARAMIRSIVSSKMKCCDKNHLIGKILSDSIWTNIKTEYKLNYLPIKQRILTFFIFRNNIFFTKVFAYLMELRSK